MEAEPLPQREFTDPATIRLISTAYISEPALSPLADDDDALAFLSTLEGATSARQYRTIPLPLGIDAKELLTESHGYGWSYVNAAFCYTRPTGNRFNDQHRGAWYAAYGPDAARTAQEEVSYHLTTELGATGVLDNTTAYRELVAGFTTRFVDLTNERSTSMTALDRDINIGYPAGQALARQIMKDGGNGVLYPSVRHVGGFCLAAFRPNLVQNVRQGVTWVFTWTGSETPSIEQPAAR